MIQPTLSHWNHKGMWDLALKKMQIEWWDMKVQE